MGVVHARVAGAQGGEGGLVEPFAGVEGEPSVSQLGQRSVDAGEVRRLVQDVGDVLDERTAAERGPPCARVQQQAGQGEDVRRGADAAHAAQLFGAT
ncbi:hypothetical protein [Streptomyces justiciae]|uniref:Uncharacterized protein n=1 Tax=Streptomyces justiciae TaxID=2780140 RepID=A0ABU3LQF1_9ACTN|nr:hypothetical protein [Streptomyces justiciae]MDT7840772.1 hypothetical protein [Streptomyces justiciae]